MKNKFSIDTDVILPSPSAILKSQGVPPSAAGEQVDELVRQGLKIFQKLCRPVGMLMELTQPDFEAVYHGEGDNFDATPLETISPKANHLALYAVTIGEAVCSEIRRLFEADEYPLGAMLDSTASQGAELASEIVLGRYRDHLETGSLWEENDGIMSFSPGYCGWHVTGQKRLFGHLHPEEIGINLSESCLMQPLKSISGVMVVGPKDSFEFEDDFSFCDECRNRSCRDRINAVYEQ